ncbi:MAG: transglycosylase family protein [Solirubrobacterales bacterium]
MPALDNPPRGRAPSGSGRNVRAAVPAVALLVLLLLPAAAGGQGSDSLRERIEQAREEAGALAKKVEGTTESLAAARSRAAASRSEESALTDLLASGESREANLARRTSQVQDRLRDARRRLDRAVRALSGRLVAFYKAGELDSLVVLLNADGYDDLATRSEFLRRIEQGDARLVARVREVRREVDAQVTELRAARDARRRLNERLRAARDRVGGVRRQAEAEASVAERARGSQSAALGELRANVSEWTREVERIERVSQENAAGEVISWFGDWAIPQAIVMCESGGNYSALNPSSGAGGAYQIIPSTWKAYGGKGLPHQASKTEQDRIAALIWRDSGPSAWVCTA